MNAIFYQNRTGCQWRYLPHDLPASSAVFSYFTLWREGGLVGEVLEALLVNTASRCASLGAPDVDHFASPTG